MLRVILLGVALLFAGQAFAGARVALVVGNSAYGPAGDLANPVHDARRIAGLLEGQLAFQVILAIDADQAKMQNALIAFGRAAEDADVALFFYAGHGVELEGANYLLPVRADIRSEADLIVQAQRLDQVLDVMARAGAKMKVAFVDACRNNPLPSRMVRGAKAMGLRATYVTNTNTLVAFATQPGQVAYDGDGRNSPFTLGLLDNLPQAGVEVVQMFKNVRAAVYEATGEKQFPWYDDMFLADFYLAGGRAVGSDAVADLRLDMAACTSLGDDASVLMMQAYLDNFPKGYCAASVRRKLSPAGRNEAEGERMASAETPSATAEQTRGVQPGVYTVSSYWNHNGSVLALSASGDSRVFYYSRPSARMAAAGTAEGTLLFKGSFARMRYSGQAYLFSKRCAPIPYAVEGRVSADYRRVELQGRRPVRDENCRTVGTRPEKLVFDFRAKSL